MSAEKESGFKDQVSCYNLMEDYIDKHLYVEY